MKTKDTGSADSTIDATNDDVVEKPTVFDAAVTAFAFDEGEDIGRGFRENGF